MSTKLSPWYAFTDEGATVLHCAECDNCIDLEVPRPDHHPRVCPKCEVECVYLNWKGRMLQIVMKNAPPALAQAIRLAQQHFDELEYVEFVSALEQVMDDLYSPAKRCT